MIQIDWQGEGERHAKLERVAWSERAATAHHVSTLPAFRRQFSHEILRPGLALKVGMDTQRKLFVGKYGREAETAYRFRFRLVLKFLETWRAEILQSGLADGARPMAVREEFVDYLLKYQLDPTQNAIPKSALRRFLDEWGHRRI